jgi:hypothetical protein
MTFVMIAIARSKKMKIERVNLHEVKFCVGERMDD